MNDKSKSWRDEVLGSTRADAAFRSILDFSPLAVIGLTNDGIVTLWSQQAEQCFGWSEDEVLGRSLPTVPPQAEDEFHRLLAANMQGERNRGLETTRIRKD